VTTPQCDNCIKGKFHSGQRPSPEDLPWAPGEYFTSDLFGPLLRSAGGARYAAFYIDLKSRFVYVKILRDKTDHYKAFVEVIVDAKARSGNDMRYFKSDGDGIFIGKEATEIYQKYRIRHTMSAPGDSASNDIAELRIRTMAELTRTNLLHAGAPPYLWAEAMAMVVHVWNNLAVCPNSVANGIFVSRCNLFEGNTRKYDLTLLRAFGTKCFFLLTVEKKGGKKEAVGPKAKLGAIVGIVENMAAYRVYDFDPRGKMLKIPFAHPFKDYSRWTQEEKDLPDSFIPSFEARCNPTEWEKFKFSPGDLADLDYGVSGGEGTDTTFPEDGISTTSIEYTQMPAVQPAVQQTPSGVHPQAEKKVQNIQKEKNCIISKALSVPITSEAHFLA